MNAETVETTSTANEGLELGVPLPEFLDADKYGYVKFKGHRIGLDQIVYYYNQGYSAEMLACDFPTLSLALIHHAIAFYLDHRKEVERYVSSCKTISEQNRRASRGGPTLKELRERLAALHAAQTK